MTEDLGSINRDLEVAHTRAQPVPPQRERPRIEPFLGGRLRQWSAMCMGSAFGVMFSDVIDTSMTPLRTKVEPIRAIPLAPTRPTVNGGAGARRLVECSSGGFGHDARGGLDVAPTGRRRRPRGGRCARHAIGTLSGACTGVCGVEHGADSFGG